MAHKGFRQTSREDWGQADDLAVTVSNIQLGAILRIADSLEKMEKPFIRLLDRIEYLESSNKRMTARIDKKNRQIAAYKGIVKRMKKGN